LALLINVLSPDVLNDMTVSPEALSLAISALAPIVTTGVIVLGVRSVESNDIFDGAMI